MRTLRVGPQLRWTKAPGDTLSEVTHPGSLTQWKGMTRKVFGPSQVGDPDFQEANGQGWREGNRHHYAFAIKRRQLRGDGRRMPRT